jgi:uncharacterized membrane protein
MPRGVLRRRVRYRDHAARPGASCAGRERDARQGLEHEWPRYLGYVVSFTFIAGVWIAHNYMTRFVKATDRGLIRLNLLLLLFVSFLPFTTAIAATHLFPSFLPFADHAVTRADLAAERAAVVIFGLNLTLAALMLYVMIRHAGRTPGLAADDTAQLELRGFARERKTAVLLQASAAVVGLLLPVIAVIFYLAVSMIYLIEPFREVDIHAPRATRQGNPDPRLRPRVEGWAPPGGMDVCPPCPLPGLVR